MSLIIQAEWVNVAKEPPPYNVSLMGLTLQRYLDKPSDWGTPFIFTRTHLGYGGYRPQKWLRITLPPVPVS